MVTRTGLGELIAIDLVTLPMKKDLIPVIPRAPMTIRSALKSSATLIMTSFGAPSSSSTMIFALSSLKACTDDFRILGATFLMTCLILEW